MKIELFAPGEQALERLKFRSYYRPCELVLTDRRVLVFGASSALSTSLLLPRGEAAAGFPLAEFDSFIVGRGRRPGVLFLAVALAIAGGVMLIWPESIYPGLCALALAVVSLLAFTALPTTFIAISSHSLKVHGRARLAEAAIFIERVQLAADAVRMGLGPEAVREAVKLSGKVGVEKAGAEAEVG